MTEEHFRLAADLRHQLHCHPELSMGEGWTKAYLMDFLGRYTDLELVDRGRWFYAVYRAGTGSGRPPVAFRADMDAVPVDDPPGLVPYASQCPGAGHKCGHDGHSASLAGFALELAGSGIGRDVYLLFQHAEETGQGAAECVALLKEAGIGEIYAFHNLPGLPLGKVAVRDGVTQPASTGMILTFEGVKSHASYPEDGKNPAFAVGEILTALPGLTGPGMFRGLALVTVIQVSVGERAFGTSAGHGELLLTVRGEYEEELDRLCGAIEALSREKAGAYGLGFSVAYSDRFPETRNHPQAAEKVRRAAEELGLLTPMGEMFRASEDFGYYTKVVPGAMFYLGSGDAAPLHTPGFDFPDVLIPTACRMFLKLAK